MRGESLLAPDRVHRPLRLYELCRLEPVALPFVGHAAADRVGQRGVVVAAAEEGFDVRFGQREQAVADFAVRGEPEAVTASAKWPGYRGDDADAAAAVQVAEIHRRRPRV